MSKLIGDRPAAKELSDKIGVNDEERAAAEEFFSAMETVEYYESSEEPSLTGWYIVYRDAGETTNYDAIGPFDSEEEATAVMNA